MEPKKCIWIIDAAYLFSASPGKFDYLKLKTEMEREIGSEFYEIYYLNSISDPPTDAQNSFHNWLKTAPPRGPKMRVMLYQLKSMGVKCPQCGNPFERQVQRGVDVGIATLTIKLANQNLYDRLLLSAGDGDFEDAIDHVKSELHKEIWINGYENTVSADLQSLADRVIWLNLLWEKIRKEP